MKYPILILYIVILAGCISVKKNLDTVAENKSPMEVVDVESGPMLGYSEHREVQIWVQTKAVADVQILYSVADSIAGWSDIVRTSKNEAFTAHLTCSDLEPGTTYTYDVVVNGQAKQFDYPLEFATQDLWQWRHDPPEFTFALGSCNYVNEEQYDRPDESYGGNYEIFESIADVDPDMMLWLGDNTYLREVDYTTRSGFQYRYTHTRKLEELQRLLATCPNYAIWDDHDFGPNDSNGSFFHKEIALETFKMFWANNGYGLENEEGIMGQFLFNDMEFFLLDNRYHRSHHNIKGDKKTILGNDQLDWLIQALKDSKAPFKFVCVGSAFLTEVAAYENYAQYKEEKAEILERLSSNKIEGVFFLTGDRHMSELCMDTLENGNAIFDLTVSPFTSTAYDNCDLENGTRVEGTCYPKRNFATINVSGPYGSRSLKITLYQPDGTVIWVRSINQDYELIE